jgi:glycosyltransferase involved in cell wall biosynthesis
VTLVAGEILGYVRTGGLGTATTFLAIALARMGHEIEILYVGERPSGAMAREWAGLYESAGVDIRMLPRSGEKVEPAYFARARDAELALRADPPDVVITQDLGAPVCTALRLRSLGLAFQSTLFVAYCHGTRQWITDTARKVRVLPGALAVSLLEQASVELADVVVSPSAYMLDWMERHGWRLPAESFVIPYLTRSNATGEAQPRAETGQRIERIAFFGRLEERKGLRPFAAGLNTLSPELLENIELEFLGAATPAWPPERVEALLSDTAKRAFRGISFEPDLDQPEVLARLSRPGTVAVMPSLEDNSPTAVYECLERGIPFVASDAGGVGELIAPDDRSRVLFVPTPEGVEAALRRALSGGNGLEPVRPGFDASGLCERWADVIETQPPPRTRVGGKPSVDVVVVQPDPMKGPAHCLAALEHQSYAPHSVIVETSRLGGLRAGTSEWVVFLDDEDAPGEELLETLVRAQVASGADVVTCGMQLGSDTQHFFIGEPGGLGLLSNCYGAVGLIRRSLLSDETDPGPVDGDPDWRLFARLSMAGAHIVSVPTSLVDRGAYPSDLEHHSFDTLLVVQQLEQHLPRRLRLVARLAAGLAAPSTASPPPSLIRRARARLSRLLSAR